MMMMMMTTMMIMMMVMMVMEKKAKNQKKKKKSKSKNEQLKFTQASCELRDEHCSYCFRLLQITILSYSTESSMSSHILAFDV